MKPLFAIVAALAVLLGPYTASAQQEPPPMAMASYYRCDQSREAAADTIMRDVLGAIFDRHVSAGHLSAWGWLGHQSGGEWRRANYFVAPNLDVLLDTRDQIIEEVENEHADDAQRLFAICPSHDDYIWTTVATSQEPGELAQARPEAGYSTYFQCDISREARADTLLMEAIAPILNRHVGDGELNSWSWLSHRSGGKWRRLAVYDGANHKTLLNTLDKVIAEIGSEQAAAGTEFSQICNAHQDYMWNIVIARP